MFVNKFADKAAIKVEAFEFTGQIVLFFRFIYSVFYQYLKE